jgi:glycine/D-amino acid oxidase-like deaminating enzyme
LLFAQALEWSPLPDGGVSVTTDYKTYHADKLVISSGAWMDQMVPELKVNRGNRFGEAQSAWGARGVRC